MERVIFEGNKKQCNNLKKLVIGCIPFGHHDDYPELIKNDFSIIDETFDFKVEIMEAINILGVPEISKETKVAEKLAKQAIEEWTDEILNAYQSDQNGLQYYIEQAILSGMEKHITQ